MRINGLFLAVALAVLYLLQHRGRLRRDALALVLPVLAVGAFFAYLRLRTGTWNACMSRHATQHMIASSGFGPAPFCSGI